ncbi:MAG: Tol-Pal system beta propeller repeat protein TolB [Desulfotignum sp.]|nr:Tol-Pal system beta propeller repeat protein TolB [Desulfotignum sp.]MCF8086678.1 Tol-Pal system beta propeller repeat protein TolB [Desulfotignum sp.]MCF8136246.1 Tol-Pal system beta propeller repeat protein TolB [Desulfotignum sp.]
MTRRFVVSAIMLLLMGLLMAPDRLTAAPYDTIQVSNPFLNKTPIALPAFKALTGSPAESQIGAEALETLENGLAFTGFLKQVNPAAFLADPSNTGIQMSQINFSDWTGIGAELLITGGVEEKDGRVKLALRLFDTFNHQLLKGKVYTGPPDQVRRMIHLFCAEVSHALTGKWGVFASKLTFVSTVDGNKEIFVSDFDGHNPTRFTRHKSISLSPAWSSDGQWLAYVSYAGGKPDIYIRHLEQKRGSVIKRDGMNITPAWMPGQDTLAAALSFSGNQEIYLLTRQGEMIKKITSSWGINVSPQFSPDGGKLAFVSNRSGTPQIYIKDLSSGEVDRVTFQGRYNTSPAWSPDGKKIAYVGIEKNRIDIYMVQLDKGPGMPVQLTRNQGDNEDPAWSPDGNLIVFTSTRDGRGGAVFVMTAAGTDQRRLMNMPGRQTQPRWSEPMTYKE